MGRLHRVLAAAVVIGLGSAALCPESAFGQSFARSAASGAIARPPVVGAINGTVSDERGGLLAGVTVSVYGATAAIDVTDAQGRFSLAKLPVGDYTLHARLPGFTSSRREAVRLTSGAPAVYRLQLRRLDRLTAATDDNTPDGRTIVAAGFALPPSAPPDPAPGDTMTAPAKDDHSHSETAWWLRHLPRSILKDAADSITPSDDDDVAAPSNSSFDRRSTGSAYATSLFGDIPLTGEVNLLTTGAIGGRESFFSGDILPRGVAYLSIGAPTPLGAWSMRAAMGEGDLSSWIVAGSILANRGATHAYDFGFSYSTQEYQGGNPMALAAVTDGGRNVGEVYAFDRWTISPGVMLDYGGRYARYDYLPDRGLLSPRAGVTLEPSKGTRLSASLSQRMLAPGAEEFLSPRVPGPWLPPERTFSPVGRQPFSVEQARTVDLTFEHAFDQSYSVGVRRFFQEIDNQLVTLFGLAAPAGSESVGHYHVANGGDAEAQGWGLHFSTPTAQRVKASVDYSLIHTQWGAARRGTFTAWKSASAFSELEGLHDITTSVQADIAETATRVFVLYKVNTAFAHASADGFRPGIDGRFDMQVNQALPFGLAGTKWEVLVGLRNLFRDPSDPASVFDEILVVRPPTRVVGGFLVRF